ncbi:solute carrier organic anion transporter family member 1B1 isoform X1 [Monodelphis domestica]|uniref:solute carrier organic anion transporter family member 1B1 isoform X1 n=1 Tax=Monodelphis domestica TaxID=13616 RepID=UPI0024E1A026|nr:solute carrier organic anion transporter family member 1B1 isoform X1 [Monodelphis domestica]XP_007503612.2 solute carrier organic anion transporter family member 1B1 isoform X1 [Monodelphis domestica]XP_007503614.2 solute carrier organic anion transporter family member 1B1 isoform X1 [Monodelphis domestica]XP_056655317.1 solute carrier organic anion transporter family member 1B1 isoform X1 [Monodelphis domestica]XP_056655318.1 solute carrier organic anion transporter family member 1B1 isofo
METKKDNLDSRKVSSQYSARQTNVESSSKKKTKCSNGFKIFMVALVFSFIFKVLVTIFMKSSITQIERRFGITTSEAGLIDGSFEIGNSLLITLVSHYGAKSHIPRLIGTGCFVMGIGSILIALPHFFMGYYRYDTSINVQTLNSTETYIPCKTDQYLAGNMASQIILESGCKNESSSPMWIYVMVGNILRGIGETPLQPLGITYIDNFANEGHASFYIGILQSLSSFGTITGSLLGALCARLYVDIGYVDLSTITIKTNDSRWVGAWWLGFIITGTLIILSGVPFFFIPKSQKKTRTESKVPECLDISEINDNSSQQLNFKNLEQIKDQGLSGYLHALKRILCNRLYLIFLISSTLSFTSLVGTITYQPKYLEQEYGESISKYNLIFGLLIIPLSSISTFLGGYIPRKWKLDIIGIAKVLFISQFCGYISELLILSLNCGNRPIAGLTATYNGDDPDIYPQNFPFPFCNSDCNCDANLWDPVCGDDGLTYMSPCLAGCKSSVGHGNDLVFHNCSCVEINNFQAQNFSAYLGECSRTDDCSRKFIYYMAVESLAYFFYALGFTPGTMLIFKNVEPELKSLAIGFYVLFLRIIGGMLTPIYFGAIIDSTCLKWATNACGDQGACRIYDPVSFRNKFIGFILGIKVPVFILFIFLFIYMKKKYKENTGISKNRGRDMDDLNLKESLNNDEQLGPFANSNYETYM